MADELFVYACVHAGMLGVTAIPLFIFWMISLCMARRRKDPARTGLTWLKTVFPFLILSLILLIASDVLYAVVVAYIDNGRFSSRYRQQRLASLSTVQLRLATVGLLFERFADVLLIITLVELANGFFYALDRRRTALQQGLRYTSFVVAAILAALAVAFTVRYNTVWNELGKTNNTLAFNRSMVVIRRLGGVFDVLNWIVSLALLVLASFVMHKYRNVVPTKSSAVVFLVAVILNFIRSLYFLVSAALWTLNTVTLVYAPAYIQIIDGVLNTWLFFVVLVLLFVIGVWKHKGLWSTAQPFMNGPAGMPPMVYAAPQQQYGYGMPQQQTAYQQQAPYQQQVPYQQQAYAPHQSWQGQPVQQPHVQHPQQAYSGHTSVSPIDQNGGTLPPQQVPTPGPEGQANGFYAREMKA